MSRPGIVSDSGLSLSLMQLEARQVAPRRAPGVATGSRAAAAGSRLETPYDLSSDDRHDVIAMIGATGVLAIGDRLSRSTGLAPSRACGA